MLFDEYPLFSSLIFTMRLPCYEDYLRILRKDNVDKTFTRSLKWIFIASVSSILASTLPLARIWYGALAVFDPHKIQYPAVSFRSVAFCNRLSNLSTSIKTSFI